MADDSTVSYSVKELIERLERKLDTYLTLLAGKADRTDVQALEQRVGKVEDHLSVLVEREHVQEKHTEGKRWLITALASIVVAAAAVAALLLK
ncbi:hypothetical protein [Streptomyces sp. NPDC093261]|uniref:hypothetical protein n=1 Tax=Streptomyces sp. NPDC093261 TaxID=3366037 RepID=UPI0037FD65FA